MTERVSPEQLAQYAKVMREHGVHDFASGDTRILISPASPTFTMPGQASEDPLRPLVQGAPPRPLTAEEADAAADEELYASVS